MKELVIQHLPPTEEGKTAQVRLRYKEDEYDDGEEIVSPFNFAIAPNQREALRWYLEEYLLSPRADGFADRAQNVEDFLPAMGTALFQQVFDPDKARDIYGSVKNDLANTRIRIDANSPEGVSLPWELLRDPARREHGELFRHAHSFVRGDASRVFQPPPSPSGTTLRILYVLSRPDGEEDVPFQAVARPLIALFRDRDDVEVEVLRPATFERFMQVMHERPGAFQIVHFDGHGSFPDLAADAKGHFFGAAAAEGKVYFEDGPHTGTELAVGLTEGRVPVVLLNACRSAQTVPGAMFPSVANQLLQGGARAVVAMAYSVFAKTAERYMTRLYERLLSGDELAQAHKRATQYLQDSPGRKTSRGEISVQDWMVPKLFESSPVRLTRPREVRLTMPSETDTAAEGAETDLPEAPQFGFIGRDGTLLRLEREFQKHNVVLLWGMAGIGKTETSAAFARWLFDTTEPKIHPFFFTFEKKTALATVLDGIGKGFQRQLKQDGIEWEHVTDIKKRRHLVLQMLRKFACFLIFDNFEPVAGFAAGTQSDWTEAEREELRLFLSDLRGSKSKVLVTSRREESWLNLPGPAIGLTGLRLYEAEELAFAVLQKAGLTEQRIKALPQFDALLKYLGGNPLAIQVILPELKRLPPEKLLTALRSGEVKLTADDASQGRSRSLAASLIYRLDNLDSGLRERLSILGLFSGFVDADVLALMGNSDDAPAVLKGRTADVWRADLDTAAEVGLLRTMGQGIYTVHPALPWFFHDSFATYFGAESSRFETAFAQAYAAYGNSLFGDHYWQGAGPRILLRLEETNMKRACVFAQANSQDAEVATLSHLAGNLAALRHDFAEAEKWYRQSLEIAQHLGNEYGATIALQQLGNLATEHRDFAQAEKWYRQSLKITQRLGNDDRAASILHNMGITAQKRRNFAEAEKWYRQSLAIRQRLGDEHRVALTLGNLGIIAHERRDFTKAGKLHRQSLEIFQRLGDEDHASSALHELGTTAQKRRNFAEAEKWYRQSLAIRQRLGDEHGAAQTLGNLGIIAQERRDFGEAEKLHRQSLEIFQRLGDEDRASIELYELGTLAQERRDFGEAEKWYRQSLEIEQRLGNEHGAAQTLLMLARLPK